MILKKYQGTDFSKSSFFLAAFMSENKGSLWYANALLQPWFASIHTKTKAKSSANQILTIAATYVKRNVDLSTELLTISQDAFIGEVVTQLRREEPRRKINTLLPKDFQNYLESQSDIFSDHSLMLKQDISFFTQASRTCSKDRKGENG